MGQELSFLSHLRVLDLCGPDTLFAGRLFALFGADVIQVEPPQGADFRRAGELGSALPLSWMAYGPGRRSVALDLATETGRDRFAELVRDADFLIDERGKGLLVEHGIDPRELRSMNPRLIHATISPMGTAGPKRDYQMTDLTIWAASGVMWQNGNDSEEPLRISVPQAWHHVAADAAIGAMIAHFARSRSLRGQKVDVSALRSCTTATLSANLAAFVNHPDFRLRNMMLAGLGSKKGKRTLDLSGSGALSGRTAWAAADGEVQLHLAMGPAAGHFTNSLFAWMTEEGEGGAGSDWDWRTLHERIMADEISTAEMEAARDTVAAFLAKRTLGELAQATVDRRLTLAPCFDVAELAELSQYAARGVFGEANDDSGHHWTVPASFAWFDGRPMVAPARLPAVGEFNEPASRERVSEPPRAGEISERPLEGLKVVDLSWVVAGPMIGRTLAEFGADIIRVESGQRPDATRRMAPQYGGVPGLENSAIYQNVNIGKRSLSLDLSRPEGRAVLRDLVAWADVLVESFAAGQMAKWGLDYEALRQINPGIVMLSTSLAGKTGPWSSVAGFGNIGAAFSGFQLLVAKPGEPVRGPGVPYTDFVAPRFGLFALLAVLERRRTTGQGEFIDLAQIETGVHFLAPAFIRHFSGEPATGPQGNRDPGMAPHGVFRCRDEGEHHSPWVAIAVRDDADWQRLAAAIGRSDLADDPRFATTERRLAEVDTLEGLVGEWASGRSAREAEAIVQAAGVPAYVVASSADLRDDPHVVEEGVFIRLPDDRHGEIVAEATRYTLSETPARYERVGPGLGQHNDEILSTVLGYAPDRIADLRAGGVLA